MAAKKSSKKTTKSEPAKAEATTSAGREGTASKSEWIEKIRVETWRAERYDLAFKERRKKYPDLTFSDWQRLSMDAQADRDLR